MNYYRWKIDTELAFIVEQNKKLANAVNEEIEDTRWNQKESSILGVNFGWAVSKKEKVDTSWTQASIRKRIRESETNVENYYQILASIQSNKAKVQQVAEAEKKLNLERMKTAQVNYNLKVKLAEDLEARLNNMILEAAGISPHASQKNYFYHENVFPSVFSVVADDYFHRSILCYIEVLVD